MARKTAKKRAAAPADGLVLLTGEERATLRAIAARAASNGKGVSAFDRAMALEVGEWDVCRGGETQSLAMSLAQARKRKTLGGKKFEYGNVTVALTPNKIANVLWVIRTK